MVGFHALKQSHASGFSRFSQRSDGSPDVIKFPISLCLGETRPHKIINTRDYFLFMLRVREIVEELRL
ncbi:hypothetical protein AIOGIFDO_01753 [Candidatus Methanoperedenaceae archaeon GB37]|nr:hypothetical protein AIOGIFDO_01753 [Candidatus Methanoperedenaceae archaeon GB37]